MYAVNNKKSTFAAFRTQDRSDARQSSDSYRSVVGDRPGVRQSICTKGLAGGAGVAQPRAARRGRSAAAGQRASVPCGPHRRQPRRRLPPSDRSHHRTLRPHRHPDQQRRPVDARQLQAGGTERAAPADGRQLLGHGLLHTLRAATHPAHQRQHSGHLLGGRLHRTARAHRLFGIEIRHARIP